MYLIVFAIQLALFFVSESLYYVVLGGKPFKNTIDPISVIGFIMAIVLLSSSAGIFAFMIDNSISNSFVSVCNGFVLGSSFAGSVIYLFGLRKAYSVSYHEPLWTTSVFKTSL